MFNKNIIVLSFAACVLADPVPRPAPEIQSDVTTAPFPSDNSALSSYLASLTAQFSGMPTLPASVESYLESAAATVSVEQLTDECALPTSIPDYIATAPGYVKSALSSYDSALESWYSEHSTGFSLPSVTGTYTYTPTGTCGGGAVGTTKTAASGKATPTTGGSTATGKGSTAAGGSTGTGTGTGGATKASNSAATSTGTAAASTGTSVAAPRNGGVLLSFAGVFGVLGFMAVL